MTRIDAYTHVLTEHFFETLVEEYQFQGLSGSPAWLWDFDRRFEHMDEFGVDQQVITLALPQLWQGMDRDTALELTRLANDEVARLADEHPDRFVPVGTLPFPDDPFLDEFDRCVEDLDMAGVQIFSNVDGRPIDDEAFHPLYARAERHDAPLWMHPQQHEWYEWIDEGMEHRLFGWPFDTTVALSRLVFSGVTEEYDFDLVSHHLGGMVPFYGARIEMFYETRLAYPENYDTEFPEFSKPPVEHFRDFHADTAVDGGVAATECGHAFFGDNVVFGTDYPFGPGRGEAKLSATIEAIEDADLSEEERAGVYGENLAELL